MPAVYVVEGRKTVLAPASWGGAVPLAVPWASLIVITAPAEGAG